VNKLSFGRLRDLGVVTSASSKEAAYLMQTATLERRGKY